MPSPTQRIQETLYKSSLFADLEDAELDKLAVEYRLVFPDRGTRVIEQGEKSDSFYLIHRGEVELLWNNGREEISMAALEAGDYFGEEGLLRKRTYQMSAHITEPTTLIEITQEQLKRLIKDHPAVRDTLKMVARTQELVQQMKLDWLGEDENVYLVARRHPFNLFVRILGPLLFWMVALLLGIWGWISALSLPWVLAGFLLFGGLVWAGWVFLDWRNDYYILTSERIVWLEQVIGLYANRQEAPLHTIRSSDLQSSLVGRALNFGDVQVKTFTGEIHLDYIRNPQHVVDLLEEHRQRAAEEQEIQSHEAIRQVVRERIGLERRTQPLLPKRRWRKKEEKQEKMPPFWQDFVKMRLVQGRTITYRKHWLVLIRYVWLPTFLFLGVMAVIYLRLFSWVALLVFALIPVGWWIYGYVDWRNDIFQVTDDKVFDIDRKPLGTEQRKEGSLENVLSLEVERIGLIGIVFNYGNVIIDVSGAKFVFENIFDPARAQQDIFRRIEAQRQRKRAQEEAKNRARLAEWIDIYDEEARNPYNWDEIGY
jgi:uncharacterized membrane protein YdbT with pleckstrin-like domain